MIKRGSQILIKRAQREAGLSDADYRDALEAVCGLRSSTDSRITNRHIDMALAYFEAIHWRDVDAGVLKPSCKPDAVFRQRGYWKAKNNQEETSRDRFVQVSALTQIARLESELGKLGLGTAYCSSIRDRVTHGKSDAYSLSLYRAALERTVEAKRRKNLADEPVRTYKQSLNGIG
jgi:hypothetical protein